MDVGLFEINEPGDDEYGDIVVKPNHQNCAQVQDIYRSVERRKYESGTQDPVCENNNSGS